LPDSLQVILSCLRSESTFGNHVFGKGRQRFCNGGRGARNAEHFFFRIANGDLTIWWSRFGRHAFSVAEWRLRKMRRNMRLCHALRIVLWPSLLAATSTSCAWSDFNFPPTLAA